MQEAIGYIAEHLGWAQRMLADSEVRKAVSADLGLEPGQTAPNLPQERLDSIARYRQNADPDKQALLTVVADIAAVFDAILAIAEAVDAGGDEAKKELGYRLLNLLLLNYVRQHHLILYKVGQLAGFIEEAGETHTNDQIFLERVPDLFAGIRNFFEQRFGKLDTADQAKIWSDNLFPIIAGLLAVLGSKEEAGKLKGIPALLATKNVIYGWDAAPGSSTPAADELSQRALSIAFEYIKKENSGAETEGALNLTLLFVPRSDGGPGLFVSLGGVGEIEAPLSEKWRLKLTCSTAGTLDFLIGPDAAAGGSTEARAALVVETANDIAGQSYVIPGKKQTRLEFGRLSFSGEISAHGADFKFSTGQSALVIDTANDADGFISETMPAEETRIPFNFGLGVSSKRGLYLEGGSGLSAVIPVAKSIGPVKIQHLLFALTPNTAIGASTLALETAAALEVKIGPVTAVIDQIGFQIGFDFKKKNPNLGFAELSLGFKPPNGVGLSIDEIGVTGGGFLYFDPQKGQYAGFVQLNLEGGITVKGIGLIATRLPNNARGFSLLVIITAEDFKPIPLPLGFRLIGVGGLLAINRSFDEEALRTGIKNHTLDSVMFPLDPIRNAPQILSNLNRVFPPADGHYLFGPMVKIAWGTPALITADLCLALELGSRMRLLILAQVVAILPKRENDLVRLQMDAVGVLDFDQGTAALDATLYDSRLLKKFVLTGDMAMRLKWEGSPNFALAVGGLHPAFNPPPNFPKLERIALNLSTGDNPRFRCESYFALTANTVQFGARAELYAAASGFSIQGETGFDVLIQLDPFHFLAEYHAQVQLKRGSTNLFKVRVEGALAGPRPLHIKGKATFEVLWMDVSIRFDKTLIEGEKPPPPEPVDVLPRLKEALGNSANWLGQLPDNQRPMVTLSTRPAAATEVLLHPLGTLTVKQNIVPLNLDISRFGQATPAGVRRFTISGISLGGKSQTANPVKDFFAPAQFFEMSDNEKLSRPSFEPMAAGVRIGSDAIVFTANADDWLEVAAIEFETYIVNKEKNTTRRSESEDPKTLYKLSRELLTRQARFGATGDGIVRRTGKAKYRTDTVKNRITKEGWSIVATDSLTVQPVPGLEAGKPTNYSEAAQVLQKLKQENPAKAGGLKILRLSELSEG